VLQMADKRQGRPWGGEAKSFQTLNCRQITEPRLEEQGLAGKGESACSQQEFY